MMTLTASQGERECRLLIVFRNVKLAASLASGERPGVTLFPAPGICSPAVVGGVLLSAESA
jgi:hypothetical protein